MAEWETCEIKYVKRVDRGKGLFSPSISFYHWEAQRLTASGPERLRWTREFFHDNYSSEESDAEYQKLVACMIDDGWEPAGTDFGGKVTLMKRRVNSEAIDISNSLTGLIQQLANLRDAGVLTEHEFQTKKEEILKRM